MDRDTLEAAAMVCETWAKKLSYGGGYALKIAAHEIRALAQQAGDGLPTHATITFQVADLDEDSKRLLYENLWNLYDGVPPSAERCQSAVPQNAAPPISLDLPVSTDTHASVESAAPIIGERSQRDEAVAAPLTLPAEPTPFVFGAERFYHALAYNALRSVAEQAIARMEAAEARMAALLGVVSKYESEPLAIGEPAESMQLGRLQICDELRDAAMKEQP